MDRFKILERCRENAEKWEAEGAHYGKKSAGLQARQAARDWRDLEAEIEASIAEETEGLLKQQGESPGL